MPNTLPKIVDRIVASTDFIDEKDILSSNERHEICQVAAEHPSEVKLRKTTFNFKYSVLNIKGEQFAIYKGSSPLKVDETIFDKDFAHLIGFGAFGKIKLGQNLRTAEYVAIKIVADENDTQDDFREEMLYEFEMSKKTQLSTHLGFFTSQSYHMQKAAMVMKLFDDPTLKSIAELGMTDPLLEATICIACVKELERIHQLNIIHRDIKPENIFFSADTKIATIIDFGLSTWRHQAQPTGKGTFGFIAPEIAEGKKHSVHSDIYALGVTLSIVIDIAHPTHTPDEVEALREKSAAAPEAAQQYTKLMSQLYSFTESEQLASLPHKIALGSVIKKMLHKSEEHRISLTEAREAFEGILHEYNHSKEEVLTTEVATMH